MQTQDLIRQRLQESAELKQKVRDTFPNQIEKVAREIVARLKKGGRIFTCGNGGSFCDALHLAEELIVRYYLNRPAIPAMAIETNPGALTAASNDYSYNESFARSVAAFVNKGDVLIAFSTSGNSVNIIRAIEVAKERKTWVLGFSGKTGGKMAALCDQIFLIPSEDTPRIQELHITVAHILCELIEKEMFG